MEYTLFVFFIAYLSQVSAEWTCVYSYSWGGTDTKTCDYGCCEHDCCPYDSTGLKIAGVCIGVVAVLVVGAIIFCKVCNRRARYVRAQTVARLPARLNTSSPFIQTTHSAAYFREHCGYDQPQHPPGIAIPMPTKPSEQDS